MSSPTKRLSELEHAVLGIIWRDGPCTAYAVRQEFSGSPSSHWNGSAGSIYPLVQRLEERGLLGSEAARQGRRSSRKYSLTQPGLDALRAWLAPPLDDGVTIEFDPLRTRLFFLGALGSAEREQFFDEAETALRERLELTRDFVQRYVDGGDRFGAAAARGASIVVRAKLRWVARLRRELASI